jgi:hypothetical protein
MHLRLMDLYSTHTPWPGLKPLDSDSVSAELASRDRATDLRQR